MPPSGRDLERALRVRLPLHFPEVDVVLPPLRQEPGEIHSRFRQLGPAVQEVSQLGQIAGAQHADPRDNACLRQVLPRQHERLEPRRARRQRYRQRAAYGANRTLEPQLAEHRDPPEPLGRDLLRGGEDAYGDGKVERRPVLANVGGGEVDSDALQRERVAGVRERGVHALASLLDGTLRQANGGEGGEAVRDVGFDVYQIGVDPEHRGRADPGEHVPRVRPDSVREVGEAMQGGAESRGFCPPVTYRLTLVGEAIASLSAGSASRAPAMTATALNVTFPFVASSAVNV